MLLHYEVCFTKNNMKELLLTCMRLLSVIGGLVWVFLLKSQFK